MSFRTHRLKLFALLAVLISGCTTIAYEGSSRPDSEVATIESERTHVTTIDGKEVPYSGANFAKFKVLPGEHTIGVALNDTSMSRTAKRPLSVTFRAEAGKTYLTRPVYSGNLWRPEIVEKTESRP
jgi:hypothetical protein